MRLVQIATWNTRNDCRNAGRLIGESVHFAATMTVNLLLVKDHRTPANGRRHQEKLLDPGLNQGAGFA